MKYALLILLSICFFTACKKKAEPASEVVLPEKAINKLKIDVRLSLDGYYSIDLVEVYSGKSLFSVRDKTEKAVYEVAVPEGKELELTSSNLGLFDMYVTYKNGHIGSKYANIPDISYYKYRFTLK